MCLSQGGYPAAAAAAAAAYRYAQPAAVTGATAAAAAYSDRWGQGRTHKYTRRHAKLYGKAPER